MEISEGELSQILQPYIKRFRKHLPDLDDETGRDGKETMVDKAGQ